MTCTSYTVTETANSGASFDYEPCGSPGTVIGYILTALQSVTLCAVNGTVVQISGTISIIDNGLCSGSSGSSGSSGTSGSSGSSGTSGQAGASGTVNTISKFTSSTTVGNSNATDDGTTFEISTSNLKVTSSVAVGSITASGVSGRIDASNDVVAFSTSDIRFKENIKPIENALDKIQKIGGYTFDWKDDQNLKVLHGFSGPDVGVIAQEIESILPETVKTKPNGFKGVKYEKIVPLLIQAIKELSQEVEDLKKIKNIQ